MKATGSSVTGPLQDTVDLLLPVWGQRSTSMARSAQPVIHFCEMWFIIHYQDSSTSHLNVNCWCTPGGGLIKYAAFTSSHMTDFTGQLWHPRLSAPFPFTANSWCIIGLSLFLRPVQQVFVKLKLRACKVHGAEVVNVNSSKTTATHRATCGCRETIFQTKLKDEMTVLQS